MAETERGLTVWNKRKAIAPLLPYAVWQERDGQPEMLDALLYAARASATSGFVWHHAIEFIDTLLSKATPRAVVLVSPHIPWRLLVERGDLVQRWGAVVSTTPPTEELSRGVVDALLLIASQRELSPHITLGAWSWLKKRSSLPPECMGRFVGARLDIVKTVQGLKDIEVLKSYLILVWSEWGAIPDESFDEMCGSIPRDFGGIGMGCHREDLVQRLDQTLGQLDRGIEHLQQHDSWIAESDLRKMEGQYGKLRDILQEVNVGAIARTSYPIIMFLWVTTQANTYRISRSIYVRTPSPMSIGSHP